MKRLFLISVTLMMLLSVIAYTPVKAEDETSVPEIQLGADALQRKAIVWFGSLRGIDNLASGWRVLKDREEKKTNKKDKPERSGFLMLFKRLFTFGNECIILIGKQAAASKE
jgi:hypothetical protein